MAKWIRRHVAICPHCCRIVEAIASCHVTICPHCCQMVDPLPLTYRQWEVAQQLIEGEATVDIAENLFISPKTVEMHRVNIFDTLELKNIPKLIRWANDSGLLELMGW